MSDSSRTPSADPENWRGAISMYRQNFRGTTPPAEYADLHPLVPEAAHHADPLPARRRRRLHGTGLRRLGATSSATRRRRLRRRGRGALPAARAAGCGGAPHRRLRRASLTEDMRVRRLAAVDAQTYWLSAKMPNDQLLVYGFDGVPTDLDQAVEEMRCRADACGELRLRVRDGNALTYPAWASVGVDAGQFAVHHLDDSSWAGCLDAVCRLGDDHLDPRLRAWQLHVFPSIDGVPGAAGPGTVAVLQISHVLADGARSSAMAARLFGRAGRHRTGDDAVAARRQTSVAQPARRTDVPTTCPRHREGSGARGGGTATCVAEQHPTVRRAQRAHPGPAPGRPAGPDGDDRRVVCSLHGAVGSPAGARR